jgi:diguanylate cyclase (GGDEF)-like protein/PAS domain S-box-containing protein
MTLSVRISLVIWVLSLVISIVFVSINYSSQLKSTTQQYQQLASQLTENAKQMANIATYQRDEELAQQVVDGLSNNDLISGAKIALLELELAVVAGSMSAENDIIATPLENPFMEGDVLGVLEVVPNYEFIRSQASSASLQNAYLLMALSFITAVAVGLFIKLKLTTPIRALSNAVSLIDTSKPEQISPIDIGYKKKDEIGALSNKTNALIGALKQQFLSERELREATEELQKRFRLLFEQATAGIGLLSSDGRVSISNPAFNELFGANAVGCDFANLFESPKLVKQQIELLSSGQGYSQIDIDLVCLKGGDRRHLHCLFSSIQDSREESRLESEQLVEVIIYDITHRKQQEAKVRYEADHDSLTGLLNRRSGTLELTKLLETQRGKGSLFALMMIDLDKFKPINDTYGHDVGDLVLQHISEQISALSQEQRTVNARWGGDEFVVGLGLTDADFLPKFTEQLIEKISTEVRVDENLNVNVGASVGVILVQGNQNADLDELLKKADELMYKTKRQKAKRYSIIQY